MDTTFEPAGLFVLTDIEPVLNQLDTRIDDVAVKFGTDDDADFSDAMALLGGAVLLGATPEDPLGLHDIIVRGFPAAVAKRFAGHCLLRQASDLSDASKRLRNQ